jgi:recombination associated protein RdgC
LDSGEVREHLKVGKQCFQLGLVFAERLSFVLGEDLVIRKLKFMETATEALESDEQASREAELDATFALMSGELRLLLERLEAELSLSSADA